QLPLVVGDTPTVEVPVADLGLERRRLPEIERVLGLDVEVAVAEHRGGCVGVARSAQLADGQRLAVPVDQLRLTAGGAQQPAHPLAGVADIAGACGVSADG